MIKVGDKLLIKGEVYIIQNESYNDNKVEAKCMSELKFIEMEFDTALGYAFAYEKQRADEYEEDLKASQKTISNLLEQIEAHGERADEYENDKKLLGEMCTIERERGDKLQKRWNDLNKWIEEELVCINHVCAGKKLIGSFKYKNEYISFDNLINKMNELEDIE